MEIRKISSLQKLLSLEKKGELEGFFYIPDEIYFDKNCPGISRSQIVKMRISPKFYKIKEMEEKKKDTQALRFGKMFHLAMEDFKKFEETYKVCPEFTGPRGGKLIADKLIDSIEKWELENNCKAITEKEKSRILKMRDFLNLNDIYINNFQNPYHEVVIFARDPNYGMLLKGKCDLLQPVNDFSFVIGDYKTCEPLSISSTSNITRVIFKDDYRLYYQYCWYKHLVNLLSYNCDFKFIFVEKDLPFGTKVVELEADIFEYGMDQIFHDIELLYYCAKNDVWPDYEQSELIKLPNYLKRY